MYFCPEADNTIISPTAIVQQNANQFVGYQKLLRLDTNSGHIRLIPREGHSEIQIPIYTENDLCYHRHTHTFIEPETWGGGGVNQHAPQSIDFRMPRNGSYGISDWCIQVRESWNGNISVLMASHHSEEMRSGDVRRVCQENLSQNNLENIRISELRTQQTVNSRII